ncbi:MAG: GTP 3',8-cyclase MoaA [Desulfocapsaceae bacterium]|nr:GTP 3',8-cyclase MoaA [Desulfocapsaceae bacterium]
MGSKFSGKNPPELLVDQFSRTISYLRLSITDRCNLRCIYCQPKKIEETVPHWKSVEILQHRDLLTYEELLHFASVAVSMGMDKIRLTGGEPLVRRGILNFIRSLNNLEGLKQIRLTTNGVLLPELAEPLFQAGIRHLNISLDTLKPEKFARITGRDLFHTVWQGIQIAKNLGFQVKLNVVAMRGINDDEFRDFAHLALQEPLQVRFIEFMPVGEQAGWDKKDFISASEIQSLIMQEGTLTPQKGQRSEGPARVFSLTDREGRQGSVGFISPISHHFCDSCNRLRLTSEGRLRSCLLSDQETDIREILRSGGTDDDLRSAIRLTIMTKKKGHAMQEGPDSIAQAPCHGRMSRIGG